MASCHLTKLTNILSKSSRGRYGRDKAAALKELASNSIGTTTRALSFELQQTIRLIQSVQVEIDTLDLQIKEVITEINSPLMSVPGISYTLAAIILSEIGDVERFSSPYKLLAFAGLEPSTYQSGKYNASHTPMVKRGSTYLRWAILTAARTVSMRDITFSEYLLKKQSEGKHYLVAMSHVSKKLVRVIFHLLKTNAQFVPQI
jgi:transposase